MLIKKEEVAKEEEEWLRGRMLIKKAEVAKEEEEWLWGRMLIKKAEVAKEEEDWLRGRMLIKKEEVAREEEEWLRGRMLIKKEEVAKEGCREVLEKSVGNTGVKRCLVYKFSCLIFLPFIFCWAEVLEKRVVEMCGREDFGEEGCREVLENSVGNPGVKRCLV